MSNITRFAATLRRDCNLKPARLKRAQSKEFLMGWLSMPLSSMHPHKTPKGYLDAQFTFEHTYDAEGKRIEAGSSPQLPEGASTRGLRVIASSCLSNKVWYAAIAPVENGKTGSVFAAVVLVRWNPRASDGYVFCLQGHG